MDWNKKEFSQLIHAFLSLDSESDARHFLRDLMTEKEIMEFSSRFKAAEMLAQKFPYVTIVKETGLSSTTIARVAKWFNGKEGGYRAIIHKFHQNNSIQSRRGLS